MLKLFGVMLVLLATALAGCSSLSCGDPHPYLNSGVNPPLKVPAGATVPAPDPAYEIAGVTSSAGKRTDLNAAGACLINPPQVVPSAPVSGSKPAASAKPGTARSTPSESQPSAKPAEKQNTSAPAAATSSVVP